MFRLLSALGLAVAAFAGNPLYELSGRITPVGRAAVTLYGATTPFTVSTLTGDDGRFRLSRLNPGTYTLAVFFPDRGEARRTLEIGPGTADARRRVNFSLNLTDSDFTFADAARRRHSVSARQLTVPDRAVRDYQDAQKALTRRDVPAAVKYLEHAVELAPQFATAWNQLGTIAYQTRQYERAEECFRQALDRDPQAYEPLVNLGGVLVTLERTEESLTYNIYAVLLRPNDALAHSQLGLSYFQAGSFDLALKHLETARRLDPAHFSHPQLTMAEIHLRRKNLTAAAADLEDFLQHHPDWPAAEKMRATIRDWREQSRP